MIYLAGRIIIYSNNRKTSRTGQNNDLYGFFMNKYTNPENLIHQASFCM